MNFAAVTLLLLKLSLIPLLIVFATLIGRRWGGLASGVIAGLPLTSGPVSAFLWAEQGSAFAATAAVATIIGLFGVLGFAWVYAMTARRQVSPLIALVAGMLGYTLCAALLCAAPPIGLWPGVSAIVVLTLIAWGTFPQADAETALRHRPWWDLWARMAIATFLVFLLTTLAPVLGPKLVGLLSPFPVFAAVMASFAHRHDGVSAALDVLRGVIMSTIAFGAFFLVVGSLADHSAFFVYTAASATAALLGVLSAMIDIRLHRRRVARP